MQNHGVICWGKDVEDAYWKMENTDAFCHAVTVTMQIGGPKNSMVKVSSKELRIKSVRNLECQITDLTS